MRMLDLKSAITELLVRKPALGTLGYHYNIDKSVPKSKLYQLTNVFFICIVAKTIYQMTRFYLLHWIEME